MGEIKQERGKSEGFCVQNALKEAEWKQGYWLGIKDLS